MANVDAILRDVESIVPKEYTELVVDKTLFEEIKATIKLTLEEHQQESKAVSVAGGFIFLPPLKPEVITKTSRALEAETFDMNISKIDGVNTVEIMRNGKRVFPAIQLKTVADFNFAYVIQMASVYIELVLLIASCAGIDVSVSEYEIKSMAEKVAKMLADPEVAKAFDTFIQSWNAAASITEKAKAIWVLLRVTFSTSVGILIKTFKLIIAKMSWIERIKAVAKLVAYIVAAIATGGEAVIAKIVHALEKSGFRFAKKMLNLGHLKELRKEIAVKEW